MEQNTPVMPPPFERPAAPVQPVQAAPLPMMSFMESIKICLAKAFTFKGRARRSEFWWFVLCYFVIDQLLSNSLVWCKVPLTVTAGQKFRLWWVWR